jgi:hypothetical protein
MLQLNARDRDRLVVLRQIHGGQLSVSEGSRRLKLSLRQVRRMLRRFEKEGDASVIHRGRGKRSNRRRPESVRARVLERAQEEVYRGFGPTLLAEHLSRDPEIGPLNADTLRQWMIAAGLWEARSRKLRHRKRRQRRAACGELVQMDTSIHRWLEERTSEEIVLIAMIDDATSRLFARFFPRDTGAANRRMIVDYVRRFGRMGALYTDQAGHFQNRVGARSRSNTEEREAEQTHSIIGRALESLDIELILALSPQAKGRVERLFGTLQDRLIKEMRIAGVNSLAAANCFLEDVFIPWWEARFAIAPAEPLDAHRELPEGADLDRLFAATEQRVVMPDFTIRYRGRHLQIERVDAHASMPGKRLTIETRLDGSTHFRWGETYLSLQPHVAYAPAALQPDNPPETRAEEKRAQTPNKPSPHHPWRRQGTFARGQI